MTKQLETVALAQQDYQDASDRQRELRAFLVRSVKQARKTHTLAEIGEVLGITKQGVYQLLKGDR